MKFAPYSFSKINTYEMCPAKYDFNYIQKLRFFVPNMATERGSYVHTLLENDTKSKPTTFKFTLIDDAMEKECNDIYKAFKESEWGQFYFDASFDAEAEVAFGIKKTDEGLVPCSYYDKGALFRGKIDHFIKADPVIYVADWKTGKISGWPAPLQLVMYAVWALITYPEIETIVSAFVYVEHPDDPKVVKDYEFKREHLPQLKKKVLEKILNIELAKEFPKKEGPLCDYCDYRKKGLCEPETVNEYQDVLNNMVKPYKKKTKEIHYFAHYASDALWRQDFEEITYQDGEVEYVTKKLYYELKAKGWEEDPEIVTKERIKK